MIKTPVAAVVMAASLALGAFALPTTVLAQVGLSVTIAPPPLPVYAQPPIPGPGYLWVPGYWSYGPYGFFWVPGTWVQPPGAGLLWTPGYWGWSDGFFVWNQGYWAPQIGFYGGVNYGFGYPGRGYEGGYWRNNQFYYNREVNNIRNVEVNNVYSRTVVNNVTVNRISYVGGPGGLTAQPTVEEQRVMNQHRVAPTAAQLQHRDSAAARPELAVSVNHGKPSIAATSRPGNFDAHVGASSAGGPVTVHARDLPAPQVAPAAAKTAANGQAEYQRQESALQQRQQQERQALAQMQERDHAYQAQQNANARAQAAMEQQHHVQTQMLQQRQAGELQNLRASAPHAPPRQAAPPPHPAPPRR